MLTRPPIAAPRLRARGPVRAPARASARDPRPRHRTGDGRDGMVLISVLLVIMMGTAIAMITARDTRFALRSAGHDRSDMQGRYAAEGALMATLTWFDMLAATNNFNRIVIAPWKDPPAPLPPIRAPFTLPRYPEPNMPLWQNQGASTALMAAAWDHDPARVTSAQMFAFPNALEVPFQTQTGGLANAIIDDAGSFGPGAFQPAPVFETDVYDCVVGPSADLGGNSAGQPEAPLMCMVTARSRKVLLATEGGTQTAAWMIFSAYANPDQRRYEQRRFAQLHDASAAIQTVPVPQ